MKQTQQPTDPFDETYFQNGIAAGVSCYERYRWLAEETLGMCQSLIDQLPIILGQTTLDFGCSRGYIVRALGILHREAFGCDISRYAIENADPAVKERVKLCDGLSIPWEGDFDWVLAKDVLEHLAPDDLPALLQNIAMKTKRIFVIVPLAEDGEYLVTKENWDITHQIREGIEWWVEMIGQCFELEWATHTFPGCKDNYRHVIGGHAFITGASKHG